MFKWGNDDDDKSKKRRARDEDDDSGDDDDENQGRWTKKVKEAEDRLKEKVEQEQERRAQADARMTQEEREFDNPMLNADFSAKVAKQHAAEDRQRAKRWKEEERELERYRAEEAKIYARNLKLAEISPWGEKRLALLADIQKTTVGKTVTKFNQLARRVKNKRELLQRLQGYQKARVGSFEHTLSTAKGFPKFIEDGTKQVREAEKELADFNKENPDAADWSKKFESMKPEAQFTFAKAYEDKKGQDPIVVAPKSEVKAAAVVPVVTEKPKESAKVGDPVWTSLEKVFLACYVRDTTMLCKRLESRELYDEYYKWASGCGYAKDLILPCNGKRTFSKAIIKDNLLTRANLKKPFVWSLAKLSELPKAPDFYLGLSTYPKKPHLFGHVARDPFAAAMDERLDKIDEYHEEQIAKQVSEMPVPRALREPDNGSSSGVEREKDSKSKA